MSDTKTFSNNFYTLADLSIRVSFNDIACDDISMTFVHSLMIRNPLYNTKMTATAVYGRAESQNL